jgi:hypothetical protein
MPLYLIQIKPPSDLSCGLKVSHEALLISYEAKSTIIIVPSHVQSRPVQFLWCEFSILCESCTSQQHEASHKALLSIGSQMSFIIPPYCDMRAERPE